MDKLVSIDIESTGLNPTTDRILTLALVCFEGIPNSQSVPEDGFEYTFNPGIPIPPEVTKVHGITDEMVKDQPKFDHELGIEILNIIKGRDIIGFNLFGLDLPLLWEEFFRAGIEWDWASHQLIDVGTLFKIREPRTLEAAVKTYLCRDHEGAHGAWADAVATTEVLAAQIERYTDLQVLTVKGLAQCTRHEPKVDLAGKIVLNAQGDPVFAFGRNKGQRVVDNPGLVNWMLDRDFPIETKLCLRRIMGAAEKQAEHDYGSD